MSSPDYQEAIERAKDIIESDHEALYLCTTQIGRDGRTDIEVVSSVDSRSIGDGKGMGMVRLEQAALHIQYLSNISGVSPAEVAGEIASVIERGEVAIDVREER